jgi:hypothetical protein
MKPEGFVEDIEKYAQDTTSLFLAPRHRRKDRLSPRKPIPGSSGI